VAPRRDVEEVARLVVDCGLQAHKELGPGLLESVYEAVLAYELERTGLHVERQKPIDVEYRGVISAKVFAPICSSSDA
jgi:GxxExxY protein